MREGAAKAWALYLFCGLLIALSAFVILVHWRSRPAKPRVARSSRVASGARKLIQVDFRTENGKALRLGEAHADYLVLYLFTPQDCAACLPELSKLSEFGQQRRNFQVFGIMSYSNPQEALQTRANFGLGFPILQDPEARILAAIAPPKTPWKVVLALPKGNVVLEEPSAADPAATQAFLQRLNTLDEH